jgi:membrane protein
MNRLTGKEVLDLFKSTLKKWWDDDPFRQSAVIAYYAIFSLPALLIILISSAGLAFGQAAVSGKIADAISGALGKETALQIQDMIAKASLMKHSFVASVIGILTILLGATGVFTELQKTLNTIWEVRPKPSQPFLKILRDKLFSFGLILTIGFLLLVSLVLTAIFSAFGDWISVQFHIPATFLIHLLNESISFGMVTFLFALMFKMLPDARTPWKSVWIGAGLTSFLFILGKYGLGFYFGKFQPASAYGAAGSVILILLWVSYSCMILFYGAEFTKQHAFKKAGQMPGPKPNAVSINKNQDAVSQ